MTIHEQPTLTWPPLKPGDRVRLVSPASFPDEQSCINDASDVLRDWGLDVEVGQHATDRWGYMAGRDQDRAADLNDAYADPAVRAVVTTRGGAGAYRVLDQLNYDVMRATPKPLVGFSDVTYLHLAIWRHCRIPGIHGCLAGPNAAETTHQLLTTTRPLTLHRNTNLMSAAIESAGRANGYLMGGNLSALAGMVGAGLPDLTGAILLLEAERQIGLGQIDRQLTQLINSGALSDIRAITLGRFPGFETYIDRGWNLLNVLQDRLIPLGIPILGGLELGHGPDPQSVPLGTPAQLDTTTATLTVNAPTQA